MALFACGPSERSGPLDARDRAQVVATLQRSLGPFDLRFHPTLDTPIAIDFARPPALVNTSGLSSAVRELILRFRPLFGLGPSDTLAVEQTQTDALGMRHMRFSVERNNIPLWHSQIVAHITATGHVTRLHAQVPWLGALPTASPSPTWDAEAARQQALTAARLADGSGAASLSARSPSLAYLRVDGGLRLVQRVEVVGQESDRPRREAVFIDAHLGTVQRREDLLARLDVTVPAKGRGQGALGVAYDLDIAQRGERFLLHDPTRGDQKVTAAVAGDRLPGRTVESPDPWRWESHSQNGTRGLSVDVHAHLQTLWDYFAVQHQLYGWDGKGHGIVAITHFRGLPPSPANPAVPSSPASWALFDGERLFFTDGDGRTLAPLGAALDIVAHEYSHAIVRSQAELWQGGQSAALDEGFADLLACLIEQQARPQTGNFTVGEEIFLPTGPGGERGPLAPVLSDLVQPGRSGQAQHLRDWIDTDAPGAIHHNAGIVGHMGYLLSGQIGGSAAAAIVVRALRHYLVPAAGFVEAAQAMRWAARDLYGVDSEQAVQRAWDAVGVSIDLGR